MRFYLNKNQKGGVRSFFDKIEKAVDLLPTKPSIDLVASNYRGELPSNYCVRMDGFHHFRYTGFKLLDRYLNRLRNHYLLRNVQAASMVIFQSHDYYRLFKNYYPTVIENKPVKIIQNFSFDPESKWSASVPSHNITVLYSSHYFPTKRNYLIVDFIEKFNAYLSDFNFHVCVSGAPRHLRRRLAALKRFPNVQVHTNLSREANIGLMNQADVMLTFFNIDCSPNQLFEACESDCLVVGPDSGGVGALGDKRFLYVDKFIDDQWYWPISILQSDGKEIYRAFDKLVSLRGQSFENCLRLRDNTSEYINFLSGT